MRPSVSEMQKSFFAHIFVTNISYISITKCRIFRWLNVFDGMCRIGTE